MGKKKDYTDVLLDDINSKFDAVMEAVGAMQVDVKLIKIRTEKLEYIQEEVTDLKKRVKSLETA